MKQEKGQSKDRGIRNLLYFKDDLAPHFPLFIAGIILVFLSSFITAMVPKYAGRLLDLISISMSINPDIIKMGGATILFFLAGSFCKMANDYLLFIFGEKSVISIKQRLFYTLMRMDLSFYDKLQVGEILSIVNINTNVLKSAFSSKLSSMIYRPAVIVFCLVNMSSINFRLTLVILCVLPLMHMILSKQMTKLKKLSKKTLHCYSRANAILQEALNMIVTVKAFSQEQNEGKKFNDSLESAFNRASRSKRVSIFIELIVTLSSVALLCIVIGFAAKFIIAKELTPGGLVSFLIFTIMITNSFSAFTSALGGIHQASGAADTLINITESGNIEDVGKKTFVNRCKFHDSIELKGIKFSYPTRKDICIYDGFNLVIQKGKTIGIIGSSGVGKTTLIQILLRFYHISEGSIKMDGYDIDDIPLSAYRHIFAYIPQEIKLFSGTIRYNLTYGSENVTEQELVDACRSCQCYDFICNLPNGFETVIGENGVTLSGGQKQRIAIARAIIFNAQIYILDEVTSAIDEKTEKVINDDILNSLLGKTLIVISHKQDIISKMDSVYEIINNTLEKVR